MRDSFEYDVFISFSHEDGEEIKKLYSRLNDFELRVFWSEEKLKAGVGFTKKIQDALGQSQHFVLFFTENAANSKWVEKEWMTFHNNYHIKDEDNRRMYVCCIPSSMNDKVPDLLKDIQRPKDQVSLISELVKEIYINSEKELNKLVIVQEEKLKKLWRQLDIITKKGAEARDYYRHNRFWRPIIEKKNVHIFTCARDVPHDPENKRGQGGRTNIDMWDYRSVFDITHFFASNFPNTKVTIVDPVSKLGDNDLKEAVRLADRISHMRSMLENKDCIIIGSPDVSDFAEIVLAELHQISPYSAGREKRKGFVIVKEKKYTSSAFYWEKMDNEKVGIAQIIGPNTFEFLPHEPASDVGSSGKMYGILVVAHNPFCTKEKSCKIVILSGFSGIATNAIAKILTNEECLAEFFKLDEAFVNIDKPIEALIGVKYIVDRDYLARDTRKVENLDTDITFVKLIEI